MEDISAEIGEIISRFKSSIPKQMLIGGEVDFFSKDSMGFINVILQISRRDAHIKVLIKIFENSPNRAVLTVHDLLTKALMFKATIGGTKKESLRKDIERFSTLVLDNLKQQKEDHIISNLKNLFLKRSKQKKVVQKKVANKNIAKDLKNRRLKLLKSYIAYANNKGAHIHNFGVSPNGRIILRYRDFPEKLDAYYSHIIDTLDDLYFRFNLRAT